MNPRQASTRSRRRTSWARLAAAVAVLAACGTVGCGREAPSFAPAALTVTSAPPGAAILLDGRNTGLVTPHTFLELDAAVYDVRVELAGWAAAPASRTVELQPLDRRTADFTLSQTGLRVTSTPPGARILVDGADSGLVTPAVVPGLAAGPVQIALVLDGYLAFPTSYAATVTTGQITELPEGTFVLRPRRTVLLEGFANVDCGPCPQMTDNLLALVAQPGYGPDRVLFLEFSVSWPSFLDPFYLANPAENADRYTSYRVLAAPTLFADGVKLADAVDPALLRAAVDTGLQADPGVLVDVAADPAPAQVPVTVTLWPGRDLDLTGHLLYVALYEDAVSVQPAPGSNGQTEFHHVFRDRVDSPPVLGALVAGVPVTYALTLARGDRDPARVVAVAFIQDPATRAVLQAGSSLVPPLPAAGTEGLRP